MKGSGIKKIAIIGAGGKMGYRVSEKILQAPEVYRPSFVEIAPEGIARLNRLGIKEIATLQQAVPESDIVVLAVPDVLIGKISSQAVPLMKAGSLVVGLDPAAAFAQVMPVREDIGYFVVHPHHPPLFCLDPDPAALGDYFGGVAKQDLSCALYHGGEHHYETGEQLGRLMFSPVDKTFRLTVEQMAFCEPGLVESVGGPLVMAVKQAFDRILELGVPREAAYSFLMGHLRVQFGITFGLVDARYSDGAYLALEDAMSRIFREGWLDEMITPAFIRESVEKIVHNIGT